MTDRELVTAFCAGDKQAFAGLVERYVHMVHKAAVRQTGGQGGLAEDVTQAVFFLLAAKARGLRGRESMAGWLFETTRLCAKRARRAEERRRVHEREAAMRAVSEMGDVGEAGKALLPLLDQAMAALPAGERELVLRRHLRGQALEEIAAELRISVPAATKRTQRAVARLRAWFGRHGKDVSVPLVLAVLAGEAACRAPAAVVVGVSGGSGAGAAGSTMGVGPLVVAAPVKVAIAAGLVAVSTAVVALWPGSGGTVASPAAAQAVPISVPGVDATKPVVAQEEETGLAGDLMMARFDVLLDAASGDVLRKLCTPVKSESVLYEAHRAPTTAVLRALQAAKQKSGLIGTDVASRQNMDMVKVVADQSLGGNPYITMFAMRRGGRSIWGMSNGEMRSSIVKKSGNGVVLTARVPEATISVHDSFTDSAPRNGAIHFDALVMPGESVVFIADAGMAGNDALTHAVIWQLFKATEEQAKIIGAMSTSESWIRYGPSGARALADRAWLWQHPETPPVLPARATRTLANGVTLRLLAMSRPAEYPFICWNADGLPAGDEWTGLYGTLEDQRVVRFYVEGPSIPEWVQDSGWFCYETNGPQYMGRASDTVQWHLPDVAGAMEVGVSAGAWKDVGTVQVGEIMEKESVRVRMVKVGPLYENGKGAMPVFDYQAPAEMDVRVLAVDKTGKRHDRTHSEHSPNDGPGILVGRPNPGWHHVSLNVPVAKGEIEMFVVQTRGREWVTFADVAERPTVALPERVDDAVLAVVRKRVAAEAVAKAATEKAIAEVAEADRRAKAAAMLSNPDATSPRGAVADMIVRARAGDAAGVKARLFEGDRTRLADRVTRFMVAHELLRAAAEKTFGAEAVRKSLITPGFLMDADEMLQVEWTIHGEQAASLGGSQKMVKEEGTWRMDFSTMEEPTAGQYAIAPVYEEMKLRLEKGEFATVADLVDGLRAARQNAAKGQAETKAP